jgi:hypothetical protein
MAVNRRKERGTPAESEVNQFIKLHNIGNFAAMAQLLGVTICNLAVCVKRQHLTPTIRYRMLMYTLTGRPVPYNVDHEVFDWSTLIGTVIEDDSITANVGSNVVDL